MIINIQASKKKKIKVDNNKKQQYVENKHMKYKHMANKQENKKRRVFQS